MSRKYLVYLPLVLGLLFSVNVFSQKARPGDGNDAVEPRSLTFEAITTEVSNKTVTSYFNFSFGMVTIRIKNTAGQLIYSTKVDTNTTIALVTRNAPLTTGAYTITYTDSKDAVITKSTFSID